MRKARLLLPAAAVAVAVLWVAGPAAGDDTPFHPPVPILDADGAAVAETGEPISPMETCGACHDTTYIAGHAGHADAGASALGTEGAHAWDLGPGWIGSWDPVSGWGTITDPSDPAQIARWLATLGVRHAGGDPVTGTEFDCLVCHLADASLDARSAMLAEGRPEWASTAALAATGAVTLENGEWVWMQDAFLADGSIDGLVPNGPTITACGSCHGIAVVGPEVVTTTGIELLADRMTAVTGEVFAGDRMHESGANLEDKSGLSRPWDVHAERVVTCSECHHAANNPALFREAGATRPEHLILDARQIDPGVYLERPDHRLVTEQCTDCHDATAAHDWLPYRDRHFEALACETCHIPRVYGPALAVVDHTVATAAGEPRTEWRGVEGDHDDPTSLITGYQPVVLTDDDGSLAPFNVVATWYWLSGGVPVEPDVVASAYLEGGEYRPEILAAFDADADGALSAEELVITTGAQEQAVAALLAEAGAPGAEIAAEARSYPINHTVAAGEWATQECSICHGSESILDGTVELAGTAPGGVTPEPVGHLAGAGSVVNGDTAISFEPASGSDDLYVFGSDRVLWVDIVGLVAILGVLLGVGVHAGARWWAARRNPLPHADVEPVYMYTVYERLWHWLQTIAIFVLLATGLVIHAPDLLGFASFRWTVAVHNVVAAVLLVNAALSAFYHIASGEIRQFIPRPRGFFDRAIGQAVYYVWGIFKGEPHPFEKDAGNKLNPLQQATYFAILNVFLPLQIITGIIIWGAQRWPGLASGIGGLTMVGPIHALGAWFFAAFVIMHVYLTTTGHSPLDGIKAMVTGWDEVERHPVEEGSAP